MKRRKPTVHVNVFSFVGGGDKKGEGARVFPIDLKTASVEVVRKNIDITTEAEIIKELTEGSEKKKAKVVEIEKEAPAKVVEEEGEIVPAELIYYGSVVCEGKTSKGEPCKNKAYWKCPTKRTKKMAQYMCGVHSKKRPRKELPYDPKSNEKRDAILKERKAKVEEARLVNERDGLPGFVICAVMRMLKEVPHFDGYEKVFPNYKHENRIDGIGCATLSPKSMGPIMHHEKGMPIAKNLENYHQFAKIFLWEADSKGEPLQSAIEAIRIAYEDPVPHRHKFPSDDKGKMAMKNKPLYAIRFDVDGVMHKFSYVQLRYFYCYYYALHAKQTEQFKQLADLVSHGTNLQITGYDGVPMSSDNPLIEYYEDDKIPYGHERCLFTLLTVQNPVDYPWEIYRRKHPKLYENFGI